MLKHLQRINPELNIRSVDSDGFLAYGHIVKQFDFSGLISMMSGLPIPVDSTTYIAEVPGTSSMPIYNQLAEEYFGEMPIQIGFGGGYNLKLNALEWHKGSELIVAVTDYLVMLSSLQKIKNNSIDSSDVETFYLKKGQAVELYGTTLHYSPCNVKEDGFKMIVILPRGTNLPLDIESKGTKLLRAKNKWLIAHPEAPDDLIEDSIIGISGKNLTFSL